MPITILIAEDQRLFRQSLRLLLERERDLSVVAEAMDGRQAFDLAVAHRPNIVLMDVDMPRLDGITATKLIGSCVPESKVLMLSVHDDDARIVAAVQAGACGYILKDADHQELHAGRVCQEGRGAGRPAGGDGRERSGAVDRSRTGNSGLCGGRSQQQRHC
ncbi:MAG: response regulator transcription factor [Nitrospira sp.]|nr:response regulator transcription factor [Nitrospira sp.]